MKPLQAYADPFWGTDVVTLPQPEGIAASWLPIKAMLGANDPGAAIPFGKLTCSSYTGGYSSGYGRRNVTCGGPVSDLEPEMLFRGVSHIHNDGTGFLGKFFNYFVTVPYVGAAPVPRRFLTEQAYPGYYACSLEDGVACELTVGEKGAVHRYTFPAAGGHIRVEASNDGLSPALSNNTRGVSAGSVLTRKSNTLATATVTLQGVTYYAAIRCEAAADCRLFLGDQEQLATALTLPQTEQPFGCVFDVPGTVCEVTVTITAADEETACAALMTLPSFDTVLGWAKQRWAVAFDKIQLAEDTSEDAKTVFASAYYHSLLKPTDWSGEGFLGIRGDCMTDLCTLWDMYKTQLPLVLTLFPETGKKLLHTFLSLYEQQGMFPNTLVLTTDMTLEVKQARALTELVIADAYYRGIADPALTKALLTAAQGDLLREENAAFRADGTCTYATHVLDLTEAFRSMAEIAQEAGETSLAEQLRSYCGHWQKAFDPDGLMREQSPYYEGNRWNYSFRLMSNMSERIALCGRETFVQYLDRFFGFTDAADTTARFEGFNNETDMEAPYAYHYAGRHDRLCEVLDAQYRFCYAPGRGGAPGNVDSGAMSSCYVFNCLGLFPVSGQNKWLLGVPAFSAATVQLPGGTLEIRRTGCGKYVRQVCLDGVPVPTRELTVTQLLHGGTLVFEMSETPVA